MSAQDISEYRHGYSMRALYPCLPVHAIRGRLPFSCQTTAALLLLARWLFSPLQGREGRGAGVF